MVASARSENLGLKGETAVSEKYDRTATVGPKAVSARSSVDRCDDLRKELEEHGDLAVKITGQPVTNPTGSNEPCSVLDRLDALLDDCIANAHLIGDQLNDIHERLAGG